MNHQRTVFVSGTNRGLGYEFVRQLLAKGDTVIAGYRLRKGSKDLLDMAKKNDRLLTFQVDITDQENLGRLHDFITE